MFLVLSFVWFAVLHLYICLGDDSETVGARAWVLHSKQVESV